MNLDHLRTFVAVCRHRNLTRAAEDLFLSQPAVSRQIHLLEREVGLPLFERLARGLQLTDAGRTLEREAPRVLGHVDRLGEAVRAHGLPGRGSLRVGASTTPGFYLLPRILGRFHARFPDVELHYVVENSLRIEQRLLANEIDLGFVGARLASAEIELDPLLDDRIVCFAAATHPLAAKRRIDPAALEDALCIVRDPGSATRRMFETWLAKAGVRMTRTIELSCPEAVKGLVLAGVGISYMSSHGLREEIRRRKLRVLPVAGCRVVRSIFVARHPRKHLAPPLKAFLAMTREALASTPSSA